MSENLKIWFHGLAAAFIGSAASSFGAILVAPDRFNLNTLAGFRNVILSSGLAGAASAAAYLKSSPIPPLDIKTEIQHAEVTDGTVKATLDSTTTTTGDVLGFKTSIPEGWVRPDPVDVPEKAPLTVEVTQ